MKLSMSTQGMPKIRTQNSETRYPRRATTSRVSSNDHRTQNSTQNEVLIPKRKHVQESLIPLTAWKKKYKRTRMANPTRVLATSELNVASKKIENGEKEPIIKQKRYRSPNVKKKSSAYRGVTKCKGRFESFVWDNDPIINDKKGKTVYIGGFKNELEAARAHDLVAIKIWGNFAYTNFPESCYLKEISEMKSMTKREYILSIRRVNKVSARAGSHGLKVSRKKEGTTPSSPYEQIAAGALSNKSKNEMEHNDGDHLEQHVTISPPSSGQKQNHDGVSAFARAEIAMEETNIVGETFPNQALTMQPMLPKSDKESQTSIALKNQHETVNESLFDNQLLHDQYQDLAFQNDLSFQNDLPHWSFYFDYTKTLDNALNWESSIQMGNRNPNGAENGGIGSFEFSSIGFHLMELDNQQFEAPNPQIELDHRYEPLGYEFGRNTWSEGENMIDNDFDINQYLNLNNPDMEDQETAADFTNELW